ncbi:MAG: oxidoreductase [Salibacteraceae bacterium]
MIGNKKHFLIAGATGLVGSAVMEELLANDEVGKVTILVRRPIDIDHDKLAIQIVDFDDLKERAISPNVDAVMCCLGTTMAQAGGKDAFRRVDYEYVVKLAVFAQRQNIPQFHVVSAAGAKASSKLFYNKVKGRMEQEVQKLNKLRSIYFYRPSMLLGERDGFRLAESVGKVFMKVFAFMIPKAYKAIKDEQVASSMIKNALNPKKGVHIVSNAEML